MTLSTSEPSTHAEIPTPVRALLVGGLIYLFLVGVSSLEKGINIMGADTQERLFESVSNPIAGLCIGILGTVLVQSSSASTAVIVGLVATGNVTVDEAVPMIMGANVGTTVTNTLVSLGYVRQTNDFKRAFAAATVHDFFNVFAVLILLPLELMTGVLSRIATWITDRLVGTAGSEWKSPIKQWVKKPVEWIVDTWSALGLSLDPPTWVW
jgi:sodium-dependent phosphate cotransporter